MNIKKRTGNGAFFFCSYFIWGLFLKYAGVKVEKKKKKKKTMDPYL